MHHIFGIVLHQRIVLNRTKLCSEGVTFILCTFNVIFVVAKKLQCKIIGEAANGPTLPEADPIIHKKKIMVIPDILANSGGVCISYLEWVQNNMGYYWGFDEVASKMEEHIVKGFKDSLAVSKKYKIDMRKAAMVVAVSRVVEAFNLKGIWP